MFAKVSNASKFGFIFLVKILRERNFELIDCQQETPHLQSLGARSIPRKKFLELLQVNARCETAVGSWSDWPNKINIASS